MIRDHKSHRPRGGGHPVSARADSYLTRYSIQDNCPPLPLSPSPLWDLWSSNRSWRWRNRNAKTPSPWSSSSCPGPYHPLRQIARNRDHRLHVAGIQPGTGESQPAGDRSLSRRPRPRSAIPDARWISLVVPSPFRVDTRRTDDEMRLPRVGLEEPPVFLALQVVRLDVQPFAPGEAQHERPAFTGTDR